LTQTCVYTVCMECCHAFVYDCFWQLSSTFAQCVQCLYFPTLMPTTANGWQLRQQYLSVPTILDGRQMQQQQSVLTTLDGRQLWQQWSVPMTGWPTDAAAAVSAAVGADDSGWPTDAESCTVTHNINSYRNKESQNNLGREQVSYTLHCATPFQGSHSNEGIKIQDFFRTFSAP